MTSPQTLAEAPLKLSARFTEADLYDAIARRQRRSEDLPLWHYLADAAGGPVLELGAGTGRVLSPLLTAGVDAWGLEWDEVRIAAGRQALVDLGHDGTRLIVGDARSWAAPCPMALVLATFNFLALFNDTDVVALLSAARGNLHRSGMFALEAQVWRSEEAEETRRDRGPISVLVGAEVASYREVVVQRPNGLLRVRRFFTFQDGSTREWAQELQIRSLARLKSLLRNAGFHVLSPVLDENGREPNSQSRLVFIRASPN